jgi:hypothetical protein
MLFWIRQLRQRQYGFWIGSELDFCPFWRGSRRLCRESSAHTGLYTWVFENSGSLGVSQKPDTSAREAFPSRIRFLKRAKVELRAIGQNDLARCDFKHQSDKMTLHAVLSGTMRLSSFCSKDCLVSAKNAAEQVDRSVEGETPP